tara:strand:+ start:148 stop:417 length:270 start_codon:yes stop_codon:yes gene_type:complete
MAKYTDEFILRIRRKAKEMTARQVAEEEQMTIGKINYIIYKAELKFDNILERDQSEKSKKRDWIADAHDAKEKDQKEGKGKTFLEWLLG